MNNKIWAPLGGWVGAVGLAVALAFAVPHTTLILGKVPEVAVRSLDQRQLLLPQELPAGRTLAIVAFKRSQREEVQSWIDGLQLQKETAFAWLRMPVFDLGDDARRTATEQRLLARHTTEHERARVVPVFTDREAFVRAAGLSGIEHASVLVLDRNGNILAKAEGPFDETKAQALRETVLAASD